MDNYLQPLEDSFSRNADPYHATKMKKYLKGLFELYGIMAPQRNKLQKTFYKNHGLPPAEKLEEVIIEAWDKDQREFQYFTMSLLEKIIKKSDKSIINLLEYLILTKSWWDTVDTLATKFVGSIFKKFPELIDPYTSKWMDSENIWLQRTCLIYQLKYKNETDLIRLSGFIERLNHSSEFFIQKAIGWQLREYSKTDPIYVENYVNKTHLAPLSKKEALRILLKNKNESDLV